MFSKLNKKTQLTLIILSLIILVYINLPYFFSTNTFIYFSNLFKADLIDYEQINTVEQTTSQDNTNTQNNADPIISENITKENDTNLQPIIVENPIIKENIENNNEIITNKNDSSTNKIEDVTNNIEVISNISLENKELDNEKTDTNTNTNTNSLNNENIISSNDLNNNIDFKDSEINAKIDNVIDEISTIWSNIENETISQNDTNSWALEIKELKKDIEKLKQEKIEISEKLSKLENNSWTQILNTWSILNISWNTNLPTSTYVDVKDLKKSEYEINLEKEIAIKKEKNELEKIKTEKKNIALNKFYQDSDLDWISDKIEGQIWTNPMLIDSDKDWFSDLVEINKWTNPLWEWDLFLDWKNITKNNKEIIIKSIKKWLVFSYVWDLFSQNESVNKEEALKVLINLLFPHEIYMEDESFSWITVFDDLLWADNELIKYVKIWKKYNIFDWLVDNKFNTYDNISKADYIKMLAWWLWIKLSNNSIKWIDTEYDNWFTPYFSTFYELWKINILPNSRLKPLEDIDRISLLKISIDMK